MTCRVYKLASHFFYSRSKCLRGQNAENILRSGTLATQANKAIACLTLSRTQSNIPAAQESICMVCIGELESRQLSVKSATFLCETTVIETVGWSLYDTIVKYLRHFHFRRVSKGDFHFLFVDSFFAPEGIFGNEDECDHVPKNKTISCN